MRFLLVDRITALESGVAATGIKNVTMSEDYLTHHFPDRPIMPGMLILESMVQVADWMVRERSDFGQLGLPRRVERLKFRRVVRPGDQLTVQAEAVAWRDEEADFKVSVVCGSHRVASVRLTLQLLSLSDYLDESEARAHYRLLRPDAVEGEV